MKPLSGRINYSVVSREIPRIKVSCRDVVEAILGRPIKHKPKQLSNSTESSYRTQTTAHLLVRILRVHSFYGKVSSTVVCNLFESSFNAALITYIILAKHAPFGLNVWLHHLFPVLSIIHVGGGILLSNSNLYS